MGFDARDRAGGAARSTARSWGIRTRCGSDPGTPPAPLVHLGDHGHRGARVAVVVLLAFAVVGGVRLVTEAADSVNEAIEAEEADAEAGGDPTAPPAVERFQSGETLYAFPAALEIYADGQFNPECPPGYAFGCWQMALFTEADCDALQVELGFSNNIDVLLPDLRETIDVEDVVGDGATPLRVRRQTTTTTAGSNRSPASTRTADAAASALMANLARIGGTGQRKRSTGTRAEPA